MEAIDALAAGDPAQLEAGEPLQLDAPGGFGMDLVKGAILPEAVLGRNEGAVGIGASRSHQVQGEASRGQASRQGQLQLLDEILGVGAAADRNEELDGIDGGPLVAVPLAFRRLEQARRRGGELSRRRGAAQDGAEARELETVDPDTTLSGGDVEDRLQRRVDAAQVGGEGNGTARIGVGEPESDPVEDGAGRIGQVAKHLLGRRRRLGLDCCQPALDLLGGALGLTLDLGPFEDHVARLDGGIGNRVRYPTAHSRDAPKGGGQLRVGAQLHPAASQRRDAAEQTEHEAVAKLRGQLGGQDPHHRPFQGVARLQTRNSVVRQSGAHQLEKLLGDPGAAGANPPHVHAEPRAVRRSELSRDGGPGRAHREPRHVGEEHQLVANIRELAPEFAGKPIGKRGLQKLAESLAALLVRVVAEENPAHLLAHGLDGASPILRCGAVGGEEVRLAEASAGKRQEQALQRIAQLLELEPSAGTLDGIFLAGGIDHQENVPGRNLLPLAHPHLGHHPGHRRVEPDLHLHGLEKADGLAGGDAIPGFYTDGDDHGRGAGADVAGGLRAEAMSAPLDLDPQPHFGRVVEKPQGALANLKASGVGALFAKGGGDHTPVEVNAVPPGTDGEDLEPILLAAVAEIDLLASRGWNALGRESRGIRVEVELDCCPRPLVGEDRSGNQGIHGVLAFPGAGGGEAIQPVGVDAAGAKLGVFENLGEVTLVGGAPLDHQVEIRESAGQTRAGFFAGLTAGDHLRDQGIEGSRHHTAGGHAGVDADPGTEGRVEANDAARRRSEAGLGILGADTRFDGDALLTHRSVGKRFSPRDLYLHPHQVASGDLLGDAVLHLEAWIHLEEVVPVCPSPGTRRSPSPRTSPSRRCGPRPPARTRPAPRRCREAAPPRAASGDDAGPSIPGSRGRARRPPDRRRSAPRHGARTRPASPGTGARRRRRLAPPRQRTERPRRALRARRRRGFPGRHRRRGP